MPTDTTFLFTVGIADASPVIDGVLSDDEWAGAPLLSDFVQYEPQRGAPASERTEVLVLQDDRALYVAFRVWDAETPTGQITRRDASLNSDDMVGFTLDTYRNRQSGYLFMTNLLGTKQDARIADDGRTTPGMPSGNPRPRRPNSGGPRSSRFPSRHSGASREKIACGASTSGAH